MNLIGQLNWRYATKRMNGQKVPAAKLDTILEAIRLSASGMGLQPYNVIVIEDEALRKKIQPVAFNQPQIVEASHILVFAAWETLTKAHADAYITQIAATRGLTEESLAGFKNNIIGFIESRSEQQLYEWAARQAYIALGTGLTAAAIEEVDATPMEGFDPIGLNAILGLKEKGLRSVTIMALGYRDEANDFLVKAPKVRRSKQELFIEPSPAG